MLLILTIAVAAMACAAPEALRRGEEEARRENWDAAVAYYREAVDQDPDNAEYQIKLERAQFNASQQHEEIGRRLWDAGDPEQAMLEYELAVELDAGNEVALTDLRRLREELAEVRGEPLEPTRMELLKRRAREEAPVLPVLEPQQAGTFGLALVNANISDVYRTLARLAGLNVLFDAQFTDLQTTVEVDDVTFFEALRMITRAHGHFYKPLTSRSFIIIPDNQQKRNEYADHVLKTFYLSNADAEIVAQRISTLLQIQFVSGDPELNAITMRASPEAIRVAERIIDTADKSPGEVVLAIEILEVQRRLLREYGISLSDYSVTQSLQQGEAGISVNRLRYINASDWFISLPSVRYRLFKDNSDFKLVADPRLRLTEGEEASLLIGQEVPIVNTTFNPQTLAGNQVVPIRSTEYREVGIVLGVSTRVHHNSEVSLTLDIEVSAIGGTSTIEDLPIFNTRRISSTIRLKDGETNILAGLLRDDERMSLQGVAGLADLPILGSLFGETRREVEQTDVILSITPHVIRTPDIQLGDIVSTYAGRGNVIGGEPAEPGVAPGQPGGLQTEAGAQAGTPPAPALALVPSALSLSVGQEFALDVYVQNVSNLASADLTLEFDPRIVEFVEAQPGPFLQSAGVSLTSESSLSAQGTLMLGVGRGGEVGGMSGAGSVFTLVFRGLAPGRTTLTPGRVALRGADGSLVPVQPVGAVIEVGGDARAGAGDAVKR